jgi:hypothetical protein
MGDLKVIEDFNGGDIVLAGNDLTVIQGWENMPYLGMFGGNEMSTPVRRLENEQAFDWWGNSLMTPSLQINSLTETLLRKTALNSSGRVLIEQAVKRDLEFMTPFSIVSVDVSIDGPSRVNILCKIKEPNNIKEKEFVYIWDGTRQDLRDPLIPMRVPTFSVTYEPETELYLGAAGIGNDSDVYNPATIYSKTGAQLWTIIDRFVVGTKNLFGLELGELTLQDQFTGFIMPFVGGTATYHKYNLLTGLGGTFGGGITHSGGGVQFGGVNGSFDTGVFGGSLTFPTPPGNINGNNNSFGIYSRTNSSGLMVDMWCADGTNPEVYIYSRTGAGNLTTRNGNTGTNHNTAIADSLGHTSMSRVNNSQFKVYKNGALVDTFSQASNAQFSEMNILIGSIAGVSQFTDREICFAYAGLGMTDDQMASFDNLVQELQDDLNRAV